MTLQQLSKTVDFVQATTPSNANDGETWLDTSQSPPQLKVFDGSANAFVRPRSIQNLDAPVSNAGATQSDIQTAVDNSNTASTVSNNLDAPVSGAGATQSDIANGVDSSNLSDEITSGRTRELLLLLQDKPVPEVVDPLNLQAGLSSNYQQSGSDYELNVNTSTATREDDDGTSTFGNDNEVGLIINPNNSMRKIETTISQNTTGGEEASVIRNSDGTVLESKDITGNSPGDTLIFDDIGELSSGTEYRLTLTQFSGDIGEDGDPSFPYSSTTIDIQTGYRQGFFSDGKTNSRAIAFKTVKGFDADNDGNVTDRFSAPTTAPADFKQWDAIRAIDVTTGGSTSANPVAFDILDTNSSILNFGGVERPSDGRTESATAKEGLVINPNISIDTLRVQISKNTSGATTAYIRQTDGTTIDSETIIAATDTALFTGLGLSSGTDYFVQVDAGGSSYTRGYNDFFPFPYNGEILDIVGDVEGTSQSTTHLRTIRAFVDEDTRIPISSIPDGRFNFRNRVYSENAGSNGQSDYQIATTGNGGHFGIPILTVVSVKKNGSVLDSANWSFDPNTDTVTIDTSNVTIASGDTIEIKYDFDVFDSTLQPRAYLNRESGSETSPSISHFKYEYVI